ncbi:MAG: dihydrolipoyl dehydrogenase, partial [Bacteroidales bacterium]
FKAVISRSRNVADTMSKGVQFLFKKNNIEIIKGFGKIKTAKIVEVLDETGNKTEISAERIILATGARTRELPNLKQDGKKIIGYREALTLQENPESMLVVGSGAIGSELAYFYNSMGTQVTLIELLPNVLPIEDEDVSKQIERSFKKAGMKVMLESLVEQVNIEGDICKVVVKTKKGIENIEAEVVFSAVGIAANIEGIGLEEVGIKIEKGKVAVDEFYKTNVESIYAIGDIVHGPALAHVASAEAIICVEKIAGLNPEPLDYGNIPGCTYTTPEVASVGMTEKQAKEKGYEIKVGKFSFTASGKATSAGNRDGFIKVIFDAKTDKWLGAHFVGANVTEIIAEAVVARRKGLTAHDIIRAVHPHPTMSEAVMEAVAAAYGEAIHI